MKWLKRLAIRVIRAAREWLLFARSYDDPYQGV